MFPRPEPPGERKLRTVAAAAANAAFLDIAPCQINRAKCMKPLSGIHAITGKFVQLSPGKADPRQKTS